MRVAATLAVLIYTGATLGGMPGLAVSAQEAVDAKLAFEQAKSMLADNPTGDAAMQAIELLKLAAEQDNVSALKRLGEIYAAGKFGTTANVAAAVGYYERAIAFDDNAARRALSGLLFAGNGVPADPGRAVELLQAAVDAGDGSAAVTLGRIYVQGREGVAQDVAKALALLEPLAAENDAGALVTLGKLYLEGAPGVAADAAKAVAFYEGAAVLDNKDARAARTALATLYLEGTTVPADAERAIALLTENVADGDAAAYATLGRVYSNGLGGAAIDGGKAVAAYEAAMAAGNEPARLALATLLSEGKVVPPDPRRAASLLEAAVAEGNSKAILPLSKLYATGQGGMEVDGARAVDLLTPLADENNTGALIALGDLYSSGAGSIAADPDLAFDYYSKASDLGVAAATKKAATVLTSGIGGSPNLEAAVALLEPLAQSGDTGVYLMLGDMFSKGEVVRPDIERARTYFELAAEAGEVKGFVRLAALFATGTLGVSPNGAEAVDYYRRAIEAGDNSARRGLAGLLYSGKIVRRDAPAAIALLKEAAADGDAAAATTLARLYSEGGPIAASYNEAKAAFDQASALGSKTAIVTFATALMGPQLATKHAAEAQALLVAAIEQDAPGARSALARLQASGKIRGAGVADAISTLQGGVEAGDVPAIRYLLQLYRDGLGKTLSPSPAKAAALLQEVSSLLPPSVATLEGAMLSVKTSPSLATFADLSEGLSQLERSDALTLIRRLRTLNANAYVYVVQDYLTRRGYYSGALNGLLTTATIRAFNAACLDANSSCDKGPLSPEAANVISSLMLLPQSVEAGGDAADTAAQALDPALVRIAPAAAWSGQWSYVTAL